MWEDNYLAHHGIKGQRWGIRRFQEEDGTLTKEGIERYREAKNAYERAHANAKIAKQNYKENKISLEEYQKVRDSAIRAHGKMINAGRQLKQGNQIDKGKKLADKGVNGFGIAFGVAGKNFFTRWGANTLSSISPKHSEAIRATANAFILANYANGIIDYRNLQKYRGYKSSQGKG